MVFYLIAVMMTLGTIFALAWPLLKARGRMAPSEAFNIAVYKDQLSELDRDVARGLISPSEADGARAEIGRRLLTEDKRRGKAVSLSPRLRFWMAVAVVALVPLGAGLTYWHLGNPDQPDRPLALRPDVQAAQDQAAMRTEMTALVGRLTQLLQERPDDATGWTLLARSLVTLGRAEEALPAFARAVELTGGGDVELMGDYAEVRVVLAQGVPDEEALALFRRVMEADPQNVRARYFLALGKAQGGDRPGALAEWRAMLAEAPEGAPWVQGVQARIVEFSGTSERGPTAADVAAAAQMDTQDRTAMVEGMVATLAARLEENPDDLEGWLRLGRSYVVMGRSDEARAAYRRALQLDPNNPSAKNALMGLGG